MPTGFSQQYDISFGYGPAGSVDSEFLTTASLSFTSEADDGESGPALSQFYEHSLALHEDLPSSQLISHTGTQSASLLDDSTTFFLSAGGTQSGSVREPLLFPGSHAVGDLANIPPAAYLLKIQPQTMTLNLIVGIISISQPRIITTRWGAEKYLVEVLVGDETKAGFAITYWLPSDSVAESPLGGLRPRDIVLMQNVALNVFSNRVYGSSLRRDLTKVHLLYRTKLDPRETGGHYTTADMSSSRTPSHAQLEKARRVRDWVLNFVGGGKINRFRTDSRPRWDMPPDDDTQLL
ncbi:hypothetical protein VTK26DRAFT_8363 [Humicola hyalothermophila]